MDTINEFLKKNYKEHVTPFLFGMEGIPEPTKRLVCKDGFSISIQANEFTYCTPRENKAWPYKNVELGFPSDLDPLIEEYAEDPGTTKTVFGYVPIDIVNRLIEKHGGIFE